MNYKCGHLRKQPELSNCFLNDEDAMIFEFSLIQMLRPLVRLIVLIAVIGFACYMYVGHYDKNLLPGFIIVICIPTIPTVYLCIEYCVATRNQIVEIQDDIIIFRKKGEEPLEYKLADLQYIRLFKSAGMEKGSFPYQTAEMYYHAQLCMGDGKKFIITSIVAPSIDNALGMLRGVKIDVTRSIYSTIYF
jgi:hypothetical protein